MRLTQGLPSLLQQDAGCLECIVADPFYLEEYFIIRVIFDELHVVARPHMSSPWKTFYLYRIIHSNIHYLSAVDGKKQDVSFNLIGHRRLKFNYFKTRKSFLEKGWLDIEAAIIVLLTN
jgi:hypothetical protein